MTSGMDVRAKFCKIFLFKFIFIEIIQILKRGGTCLYRFSRLGIVAVANKKDCQFGK